MKLDGAPRILAVIRRLLPALLFSCAAAPAAAPMTGDPVDCVNPLSGPNGDAESPAATWGGSFVEGNAWQRCGPSTTIRMPCYHCLRRPS